MFKRVPKVREQIKLKEVRTDRKKMGGRGKYKEEKSENMEKR